MSGANEKRKRIESPQNVDKRQKQQHTDSGNSDESYCRTCNKVADNGVIQCQWCHNWEHHQCAQLSAEDLAILSKVSDRVVFFCTQCYGKVPAALTTYSISEKHTIFDNCLSTVETTLNELKLELTKQISKCHDILTSKDKTKASESLASTIVSTMNEEKERERRRLNLIIHNAPESTADVPESRKTEDIERATDIFNVYLGAKATVTKALRLGRKTESANKPRLMKVTVDTLESKVYILRNCTKLRSADQSSYYSNIFITPDLTQQEHEDGKKLRDELKRRRQNGEPNLIIKKGRIIVSQCNNSTMGGSQSDQSS